MIILFLLLSAIVLIGGGAVIFAAVKEITRIGHLPLPTLNRIPRSAGEIITCPRRGCAWWCPDDAVAVEQIETHLDREHLTSKVV